MRHEHIAIKQALLAIAFGLSANNVSAGTLNTLSYTITIQTHCREGEVTCDDVSCIAIEKKTGVALSLKGKTIHSSCKDSSTPCRFIGYTFRNGNKIYRVLEDGTYEATENGKVLIHEQGVWQW